MNSAIRNRLLAGLAVASAPALSFAQATPVDVTSVVDAIEAAATPIGLIGGGVLIVMVTIKVYKWVRRAM